MGTESVLERAAAADERIRKRRAAWANRFWGNSIALETLGRICVLVFVVVSIAAMSFMQWGFWSVGVLDDKPVYVIFLLAPLVMGAMVFGPLSGALMGLYAGAVVYAHATFLPLDYYEIYYMQSPVAVVMLTIVGAVAGVLFSPILRKTDAGWMRFALICLTCFGLSLLGSALMAVNPIVQYSGVGSFEQIRDVLINSPLGLAVQVLADAVLMSVVCVAADVLLRGVALRGYNRSLMVVFRDWIIITALLVFMVASSVIFSLTTLNAQNESEAVMANEVDYLKNQLATQEDPDLDSLLVGYVTDTDGIVVITDENGTILATNSPGTHAKGASFVDLIGYSDYVATEGISFRDFLDQLLNMDNGAATIQAVDEEGNSTMDFAFLAVRYYDQRYVAMIQSTQIVYRERFGVMASAALQSALLLLAISVVAAVLLYRLVVRRIADTNKSLDKITHGDLRERVNIYDSRELASLSDGINATVVALSDTIAEVKRHNAQDLATAQRIQESVLPRDFPPFPEIERFDIYASMKMAKEVGGDFYDFFLIEDDKLGFIIADVSGKGIPAALFMMTAKAQVKNYMESGLEIGAAIEAVNHQLCIGNDEGMFVTMFACLLDYQTGHVSYVNAGHNPPLVLHDGTWEWMRDVSGMPLGLFDGISYEAFERTLEVGDMMYLYTDGVTEAMDASGNLFGEARLEETLYRYADMNPRSLGVGMRRAITDFTLDAEQSDDITMLVMKYGVAPEKKAVMVLPAIDTQLIHVYNYIHAELHRRSAPNSVRNALDIAAEELFVNVCHYAYPDATPENPGEVRISFEYEANPPSLLVEIADDGVPYDPTAKPDAVTPDNIEDVPIGGLGILMAKRCTDELTYRREGDSNIVTFRKGW